MRLTFDAISSEHARQACALIRSGSRQARVPTKGLVVRYEGTILPAKDVLRVAYCLANRLPVSTLIDFTSGDGTLKRLSALGLDAFRMTPDR